MAFFRFLVTSLLLGHAVAGKIVITGATGRTGSLVYESLKNSGKSVNALVRSASRAREVLGCGTCDESEGIFIGDIVNKTSLTGVMQDADLLVILASSMPVCDAYFNCTHHKGAYPKDIDWLGARNTVLEFAENNGAKPVVLVSSMGTTEPDSQIGFDHTLFYKLQFEAYLMSSSVPFTIIKPCGLGSGGGRKATMVVGHDDTLDMTTTIDRADLARVVAAAVSSPSIAEGLRFDLCAHPGTATTDDEIPGLFEKARFTWGIAV